MGTDPATLLPVLEAALDLSPVHGEHERFYSSAPLETALRLQRHPRILQALAGAGLLPGRPSAAGR